MQAGVQPFTGTIVGSLDGKGRVCIPANYRQYLAAQATVGVHVSPSFHQHALECFGEELLQFFHQQQAPLDPFFDKTYDDKAFILSLIQSLTLDENGRVRLPDDLIAHAQLTDRVAFVGMGRKFQIWDAAAYEAIRAERLARVRTLREDGGAA